MSYTGKDARFDSITGTGGYSGYDVSLYGNWLFDDAITAPNITGTNTGDQDLSVLLDKATYDPDVIAEQVVGLVATQTLYNKTLDASNIVQLEDSGFTLQDSNDSTKLLQLELGSITTGTTRTLTAPDASGTITLGAFTLVAGTATLVAGEVTVSTAVVTSSSKILVTASSTSTGLGTLRTGNIVNGTSFDIISLNILDDATVDYLIVTPN